jgi:uncharacterized protein
MPENKKKKNVSLVVGGDYHDIDYVRHKLLGFLLETPNLRTRCFENFNDMDNICQADYLITYTCNVVPRPEQVPQLRNFLTSGKRWLALHGTNSWLALDKNKQWYTPPGHEKYFELLGSQFAAHPPIEPYVVKISDNNHLVTEGCDDFEVEGGDELYYMHMFGEVRVLMEAVTQGIARGFAEREWEPEMSHPVLYEKKIEDGAILYCTLGHRRGHWDMEPLMDYYKKEELGAWELPDFDIITRRSIQWLQKA